jgi:rhamnosyltransferase
MVSYYPHTLLEVDPGSYFPGKVLNRAVKAAKTEIVVFINSDVVLLDPYAIKKLIQPLEDGQTAGSFGRQVVRPEAELWVRHDYDRAFPDSPDHPEWMHYSLPIAAMKKSVWEQLPFYTDAWGSEDTHWGVSAKNLGYNIAYVHDAVAMHSHNYTLKQLSSRRRIEGEADVYIYPGQKTSLLGAVKTFCASSLRESWYYLKHKQPLDIPYLLLNRFVYAWHYYKGFQHASKVEKSITYGNYQ